MTPSTRPHVRRHPACVLGARLLGACLGAPLALVIAVPASAQAQASVPRSQAVTIPAGPLGSSLTALTRAFGVSLTVDAGLVGNRTAPAVDGQLTLEQALQRMLAGSGLAAQVDGASVVVRPASSGPGGTLPPVSVQAARAHDDLPRVLPGGQAARGARLGALGNTDTMDAPFSIASYTAAYMANREVRNLSDVFAADPSVRTASLDYYDNYYIRGFSVNRFGNISFNGLYGVTGYEGIHPAGLERVEVIKGPASFLNGMPPSGSVGGSINLVPKRAGADPLTRVSLLYEADSNLGVHLDVGRRFGPDRQVGARVNVLYRDGDNVTAGEGRKVALGTLGLDYAGPTLRMSLDVGTNDDVARGYVRFFSIASTLTSVPAAPDASRPHGPSWYRESRDNTYGIVRADYEVSDALSIGAAYGRGRSHRGNYQPLNPPIQNADGDLLASQLLVSRDQWDTSSKELMARLRATSGPIRHSIAAGMTEFRSTYYNVPSRIYAVDYPYSLYGAVPDIPAPDPTLPDVQRSSSATLRSYLLSDTMSMLDERLLLTVGALFQQATAGTYDQHETTPALGVTFKPTPRWSLYANYTEALSQGPTAPSTARNAGEVFAPYVGKQIEVGSKHEIGSMIATLALFQIKQPSGITDPSTNVFSVSGEQRNRGVEATLAGEPTRGVRVLGGASYLDGELVRTQGGTNDGKTAPLVPKWQINVGGEADVGALPGLTATANVIHTTPVFLDAANRQQIPSWTRVDVGVRYLLRVSGKPLMLRAQVLNLFDKDYWAGGLALQRPRTLLMSATADF